MGMCNNLRCNGVDYLCGKCRREYPLLAASLDEKRRQAHQSRQNSGGNRHRGGTMASTNFQSKPQRSDSGVTNHLFNAPGDGAAHGHVKEQQNPDGSTSYPYVRDVEGTEYDAK